MRSTAMSRAALPRRRSVVSWWIEARKIARERRALAGMSPEQLRDIGLHPADAAREARRPFWDFPVGR